MKTIPSILLLSISYILICSGCSVKEDRGACPCRLLLDLSEVDTSVIRSVDLSVTARDGIVFNAVLRAEEFEQEHIMNVQRTGVHVGAWNGTGGYLTDMGLRIPYGEDCPPVYVHSSYVDTSMEECTDTVEMRKNHCNLTINIKGNDTPFSSITVMSNVCGYAFDAVPLAGDFACTAIPVNGGCVIGLPRQTDDGLLMSLDDGTHVIKTFALGTYISAMGYNWNDPDLKDITVDIDLALTYICLQVQGWDKEYLYDVVI